MIHRRTQPGRAVLVPLFLQIAAVLAAQSAASAAEGRSIAWRTDLGSAQAESRARNLPLWIQFTGPWCVNCRRMERSAFVAPPVVNASRDLFVPIKLRSDEYEQLALGLGLSSLPSTVLVRPDGQVIDKWEGYGDPDEFLSFLEASLVRDGRWPGRGPKIEVAMGAYCPVSLVDSRKLVAGQVGLTAEHDGLQYRFASESARAAFLAKPEKYAPANRGECPVRHVDAGAFQPGQPRWGVIYRGHLFLCADATDLGRFLKNPERYANVDSAARAELATLPRPKPGQPSSTSRPAPSMATETRRPIPPGASPLREAFLAPVVRLRR